MTKETLLQNYVIKNIFQKKKKIMVKWSTKIILFAKGL